MTQAPTILVDLASHDRHGNTGTYTGVYLSDASHPHAVFRDQSTLGPAGQGVSGLLPVEPSDGRALLDDTVVTSFTNEEEEAVELTSVVPYLREFALLERGAIHTKAPNFQKHVVHSQRVVTGQNPASAEGVALAMVDAMATA